MDSDEKRDFPRMNLNCSMEFAKQGSKKIKMGTALNISSTGILFDSDQKLKKGDVIEVKVPANMPTATLKAVVRINRVETVAKPKGYRFAGVIEEKIN